MRPMAAAANHRYRTWLCYCSNERPGMVVGTLNIAPLTPCGRMHIGDDGNRTAVDGNRCGSDRDLNIGARVGNSCGALDVVVWSSA